MNARRRWPNFKYDYAFGAVALGVYTKQFSSWFLYYSSKVQIHRREEEQLPFLGAARDRRFDWARKKQTEKKQKGRKQTKNRENKEKEEQRKTYEHNLSWSHFGTETGGRVRDRTDRREQDTRHGEPVTWATWYRRKS